MIDRYGNRLLPTQRGNSDPLTVYNELRFLMKGFETDPSDSKGVLLSKKGEWLAGKLSEAPNTRQSLQLLDRIVAALDAHCSHSRNTDIPWYMGWLCKNLHHTTLTGFYRTEPVDDIANSCRFFERYEQVQPTNQGRTVLIHIYCQFADKLSREENAAPKVLALLEKASACEKRMDPAYTRYNRLGICDGMYKRLYDLYLQLGRQQDALDAMRQAIRCVYQTVKEKPDSRSMRKLADYCDLYTEHSLYDPTAASALPEALLVCIEEYARENHAYSLRRIMEKIRRRVSGND